MAQALSYAVLRRLGTPSELDHARVLMIMDCLQEAESVAAELESRGIATEVRAAVGAGPTLRLCHR